MLKASRLRMHIHSFIHVISEYFSVIFDGICINQILNIQTEFWSVRTELSSNSAGSWILNFSLHKDCPNQILIEF
jgi:hypothetical protein